MPACPNLWPGIPVSQQPPTTPSGGCRSWPLLPGAPADHRQLTRAVAVNVHIHAAAVGKHLSSEQGAS